MSFTSTWQQDRELGTALINDQDFIDTLGERFLPIAVAWIGEHLAPGEVFDKGVLIEHVRDSETAEDVYGEDVLIEWAEDHGCTKDDET